MRTRLLLIPLVIASCALAAPGAALADDYCVGSPAGCTGTPMGNDLQAALDAAKATGLTPDRVLVGPGTYSRVDGFEYDEGAIANTVEIRGVGSPKPTLTMPSAAAGEGTLRLIQTGSVVENLEVEIPDLGGNLRGLYLGRATARDLTISGPPAPPAFQVGVQMLTDGNVLENSTIGVSTTNAIGVFDLTTNGSMIRDNTVAAARGLDLANFGGTSAVSRNRISAGAAGITFNHGDYDVDNTLIDLRGGSGAGIQMNAAPPGNPTTTVDANQLTIRNGDATSKGIYQTGGDANTTKDINLRSSIIWDVGHAIVQDTPGAGSVNDVFTFINDYDPANNVPAVVTPPGQVRVEQSLSVINPAFIDPILGAGGIDGDYRLRHDSFVIDTDPAAGLLYPGETDIRGLTRVADGTNPFDGPKRDLGAYEYQRVPPVAAASGGGGLVNQAIGFDGSGSTDIDGDELTYTWAFDDGGSATGPTPSHAFATPGTHTATLTVTDPVGLTDTAQAQALVSAPTAAPPGGTVPVKRCKKKKKKRSTAAAAAKKKKKCKKKKRP
jgi:PKD repeat protein